MLPRAQIAAHKWKRKPPKYARICPQEKLPRIENGGMQAKIAQACKKLPFTKFAQVWKNLPLKEIRPHGEEKMICENEMGRRLPL